LDEEEAKIVESEFKTIYDEDDKLREVLQGQTPESLSMKEKYEILLAYKKGGGVQGLLGGEAEEEEESIVEHNG